jgi:hypothetical protein
LSAGYPWFKEHSKTTSGIFKQKYHLIGALVHGYGPWVYTMSHQFAADSNVTIEVLQRVLSDLQADQFKGRAFPPKLYLQMDNCVRENKNVAVLAYLSWLVQRKVFTEIHISFLPVGHTHEDIDQVWSRTSIQMRGNDVCCEEELFALIRQSFHHYGYSARCASLDTVANIRDWIAPFCEPMYGYAGREVQHLRIFWHQDGPAIQTKKRSGENWTDMAYNTPSKGFHLLMKCTPSPPFAVGVTRPPPLQLKEHPKEILQRLSKALTVIVHDARVSGPAYTWLMESLRRLAINRPLPFTWKQDGQLVCEQLLSCHPPARRVALQPLSQQQAAARQQVEDDAERVDELQNSGEQEEEATSENEEEEQKEEADNAKKEAQQLRGLRTQAQENQRRALAHQAQDQANFAVEKLDAGHFVVFVPKNEERDNDNRPFWVGQVYEDWMDARGEQRHGVDRESGEVTIHNYTPYNVRKGTATSNNVAEYGDYKPEYSKAKEMSWTTCKWEQVLFVLSHLIPKESNPDVISASGPPSWFTLPNYVKVKLQAIFKEGKALRPRRSRSESVFSGVLALAKPLTTREKLAEAKRNILATASQSSHMEEDDEQDHQEISEEEDDEEYESAPAAARDKRPRSQKKDTPKHTAKKKSRTQSAAAAAGNKRRDNN